MKGSSQAYLCFSDSKFSNGTKIAGISLVFTIGIFKIAASTVQQLLVVHMGGIIAIEKECLLFIFGV